MRAFISRHPSAGTVVGVIALVVALGGTAVAAKKIGGGDIKKNAIKKKHIKDDAVRTDAIKDANVTGEKLADASVSAAKLTDDAQAYARVNSQGTAVSQSKGVVGVNRNATGRYCLDLTFTPNTVVATIDQSTAAGGATTHALVPGAAGCPAPFNDATVFSFGPANGPANNGFYVQFE